MKLTLIATTDIPAGTYDADVLTYGALNLAGDTIELSVGVAAPVEAPPAPADPPPPEAAPTGTVSVDAVFSDGTAASITLSPGERKSFSDVQHGSAVYHADGRSVCIEHCYAGLTGDLSGTFTVRTPDATLFTGALTIFAYSRTRPFWVSPPAARAAPDFSLFPNYAKGNGTESMAAAYAAADNSPMGCGLAMHDMETAGERADLGAIPRWDACYIVNPTPANAAVVRGMADAAAVWPTHVLDFATQAVIDPRAQTKVSLLSPVRGLNGNPVLPFTSATPLRSAGCAHAVVFGAVAAELFGTEYDREELAFWGTFYASLWQNPGYRLPSGVVMVGHGECRGKGRVLNALVQSAHYCDASYPFTGWLQDLAADFKATYGGLSNLHVDQLQVIYPASANPTWGFSPWQTAILVEGCGNAIQHGHTEFQWALDWFGDTLLQALADGVQHELATYYQVAFYKTDRTPVATWADALQATGAYVPSLAAALACAENSQALQTALARGDAPGDFTGYPTLPNGYAAMQQPAWALLADYATDQTRAQAAWAKFQKYQRIDYSANPKYNIVPRTA